MIQDTSTLVTRAATLKELSPRDTSAVHDLIRDILDTRGVHLHKATSDSLPLYKREHYERGQELDDLLIDVMVLLPHNIPSYQICIKHPLTGAELWYQHCDDGIPVYVPFAQWIPEELREPVIDRRAMLLAERSRSANVLEQIQEYEARGLSAVTEQVPNRISNVDVDLLQADGVIKVSDEPIDPFKD